MRLKSNKNANFFDVVMQHVVIKVIIIIAIMIAYFGYGFIDNMFISRAVQKAKNMEDLKVSIGQYTLKRETFKLSLRPTGNTF